MDLYNALATCTHFITVASLELAEIVIIVWERCFTPFCHDELMCDGLTINIIRHVRLICILYICGLLLSWSPR